MIPANPRTGCIVVVISSIVLWTIMYFVANTLIEFVMS